MKSNLPLISVVTPSFNQGSYLEQTILSVLEQDYPNLEYGVVDGGSTDDSLKIIKEYAGRLSWWVSEKDRGQAEAINKGLHRAKGQILAWLNSDDLYVPGVIRSAVEIFQNHPNTAMVHGEVIAIDAGGNVINVIRYKDEGLTGLLKFQIIGQPAVFFRREAFQDSGGLDQSYHFMLDHQLWLRIGQYGDIIHSPQIWAKARFHEEAKNIAQAAGFSVEAKRIVEWIPTQPGLREEFKKNQKAIQAGAYRFSGRYLLDASEPRKALAEYWSSFKLSPSIALQETHRIAYAVLSLLGLQSLRKVYWKLKRNRFQAGSKD